MQMTYAYAHLKQIIIDGNLEIPLINHQQYNPSKLFIIDVYKILKNQA